MQRTNLLEQRTQKMSWLQRRRRRDGKFDGVVNFLTVFSGVKVSNQFGGVILKLGSFDVTTNFSLIIM